MTGSVHQGEPAGAAGDEFEAFFIRYAREVAAMIAVTTGDLSLAEDATQEAMARAARNWARVSRMERPELWVVRVAQRAAIDAWRKRRREVAFDAASASSTMPEALRDFLIRWDLERLSPSDRLLLVLHHRDGVPVAELAVRFGRPGNTIAVRLKRARRRLRALLMQGDT